MEENVQKILRRIKESSAEIFGNNLTGVYVHGSLAFGCFNFDKSDIDFIVAVKNSIGQREKEEFIKFLLETDKTAPPKGLEMSVVLEDVCRNFVYPTPFELHFSNGHKARYIENLSEYCAMMHGTDKDLAAHFKVIKAVGFALCGEEISHVFGDVPEEYYLDSVKYDIDNAAETILTDTVYTVLNLCRTLAYKTDGIIRSKLQGAEACISLLPDKYITLVQSAADCYSGVKEMPVFNKSQLTEFAEYMLGRIGL